MKTSKRFFQGKAEEMSEIHMNLETKIDGFTNSLEKSLETSFSNDGKIIGKRDFPRKQMMGQIFGKTKTHILMGTYWKNHARGQIIPVHKNVKMTMLPQRRDDFICQKKVPKFQVGPIKRW